MKIKEISILFVVLCIICSAGCSKSYKAKPLAFKMPSAYKNIVNVAGADIAAKAYVDIAEAKEAFGFDVRGAGMLPVQVIFDNQGHNAFEINGQQTFFEDAEGNLWPILSTEVAYDRATKYAKTKNIFKEGAYHGLLGAAAGSLIGAAIGIVTGDNVAGAAGKGAAVGAAAGATLGGAIGFDAHDAREIIIDDLRKKTLQNRAIEPKTLVHGIIFFPGEAKSAKQIRLQLVEIDTGNVHIVKLAF